MSLIQAILPIATSSREHSTYDIERASLMLATLDKRLQSKDPLIVHIVSPRDDLLKIRSTFPLFSNLTLKYVDESSLFELPIPKINGTYIQQLVKLYSFKIVGSPHVLTLDADLVFCRGFSLEDLVIDGKANSWTSPSLEHPHWWKGSSQILRKEFDLEKLRFYLAVTPNVLSIDILKSLSRSIESDYNEPLEAVLFSRLNGWTEYTLYSLYAESHSLAELYHCLDAGRPALVDRFGSVWNDEQASNLGVFLHREPNGICRVYQSNSYVSIDALTDFYT